MVRRVIIMWLQSVLLAKQNKPRLSPTYIQSLVLTSLLILGLVGEKNGLEKSCVEG